jgi:hypothetical protein
MFVLVPVPVPMVICWAFAATPIKKTSQKEQLRKRHFVILFSFVSYLQKTYLFSNVQIF